MPCLLRSILITGVSMAATAWAAAAEDQATNILQATGVRGGLIVQLGCGDGKLTAALHAGESYLVHGLDADAKQIEAARKYLASQGLYGRVSVEQWTSPRLPYADNLVNLLVIGEEKVSGTFCRNGPPGASHKRFLTPFPSREELLRVLAPGGAIYDATAGSGQKITIKPRPPEIDEWTHFLHDAGNNAVAHDTLVGAPRSLQWMAPPLWLRSHETPSGIQAMVCGGGRVFYIFDEGLVGITDQRLPEHWALLCRDAFNGTLLWRRPIGPWGWPQWARDKFQDNDWTTIVGGRTVVPNENERRLVVDGNRLYATLEYRGPLTILDDSTGKTLATVVQTAPARQILVAGGVAVVYSQVADTVNYQRKNKKKAQNAEVPGTLTAVAGSTGKVLWQKKLPGLHDLSLAIDQGRVLYQAGRALAGLDLATGKELWQADLQKGVASTLVACDGIVVLCGAATLEARDGATGKLLWQKPVSAASNLQGEDLFVIRGVVWPGVMYADDQQHPAHKTANVMAVGYDLRTGEQRKQIVVPNLLSPEHHHRCYRNKATDRYVINGMEGAEFLDLEGSDHTQNNFLRGACRLGIMPCNGMIYCPADQCFCQPGAKLLGFKAVGPAPRETLPPVPDEQRLQRGPAYEFASNPQSLIPNSLSSDWPTYRHDAARHGSTAAAVEPGVDDCWRVRLGPGLTEPTVAGDRVYAASSDTHTLHVLDLRSGQPLWSFTASGRIDSPPTVLGGIALVGSADGWVYCLRCSDGALVWRFLAAPSQRRIVCFDQLESAWPVHGSVLVRDGIAYVAAGRSSYLDGGIRLYALDPATGKIVHQNTLAGPFPGGKDFPRDVSFYIRGANSDVLASEGNFLYMRQKRLDFSLQEEAPAILSSKGECDEGRHVFSTAGLLDSSWYNRAFWMYSGRWPGFQLANQAPKSGQLLVVDGEHTYAVNPFYRRNVHSPMFFPGKEGYLLFADRNDNEPQIVGDRGARKPVAWLPQSDYMASKGLERLGDEAFGLDKMIGYTRAEPPLWKAWLPVRIRAMVKAGDALFVAGPPDEFDKNDPFASFEGRRGAKLVALSSADGKSLGERGLQVPPVFDGMIAAGGRLLVSLEDGSLMCLGGKFTAAGQKLSLNP